MHGHPSIADELIGNDDLLSASVNTPTDMVVHMNVPCGYGYDNVMSQEVFTKQQSTFQQPIL